MKRTYILLVLLAVILLAASEASAELTTPLAPQRTCTAGSLAIIDAGAVPSDPTGQPSGDFPVLVNCPSQCPGTSLNGQFLKWDYRFTALPKVSPSNVGLQVASDIAIEAAPSSSEVSLECSGISSLKNTGAGDCDSRWLRFAGNSSSGALFVSYYTKPGLEVRPEGAVVTSGSSIAGCRLAGAGKQIAEPYQGIVTRIVTVTENCTAIRDVDIRGRTIEGSLQLLAGDPAQCPINTYPPPLLYIDGAYVPATFVTPDAQLTFGTTTPFCFTTTLGNLTCIGK